MVEPLVILGCAVVGGVLYWRGNRLYTRLALSAAAPDRRPGAAIFSTANGGAANGGAGLPEPGPAAVVGASSLMGLSAAVLFVGLTLLMSLQSPDFTWTAPQLSAILITAPIIGLLVTAVTAAKIYAFRRLRRNERGAPETENGG